MPQATVDGLRIYYEDTGLGEPALLLTPAWCMSHSGHAQLPQRCSAYRRTLTLDWRGHGRSDKPTGDFGAKEMMADCLAVANAAGVKQFVPVTLHHSGWAAIELRRQFPDRIPRLVHLDWIVLPPPMYMDIDLGLATAERWQASRDMLLGAFASAGLRDYDYEHMVKVEMAGYSRDMWMRAGREVSASFAKWGNPLQALASLNPPAPTLHIFGQPDDPGYLAAEQAFAKEHPWFNVLKVSVRSNYSAFEIPDYLAATIDKFVAGN